MAGDHRWILFFAAEAAAGLQLNDPHLVIRQIEQMAATSDRHAAALAELITSLGGQLRPETVHPANQYLSFLTLQFLLPKLASAKRNTIERYENALRALPLAPPELTSSSGACCACGSSRS